MITWTTYGTWLQGDNRGYVKNGKILPANPMLSDSNKHNLTKKPIKLSKTHRTIITKANTKRPNNSNIKFTPWQFRITMSI